jgi:hypothetical protein
VNPKNVAYDTPTAIATTGTATASATAPSATSAAAIPRTVPDATGIPRVRSAPTDPDGSTSFSAPPRTRSSAAAP